MTPALVAYFIALFAASAICLILFVQAQRSSALEFVAKAKRRVRILALLVVASGFFAPIASVGWAFHSLPGVDASQKARFLAESISEAMNFGAFSFVLVIPNIAFAVALTLRHRQMLKDLGQ